MEKVADGVWLLRGDTRKAMNIYFLEDGDGVVQFDAGTKAMVKQARAAATAAGRREASRARSRPRRPPRHCTLIGRPRLLPSRRGRRRRKRRGDCPLHGNLGAAGPGALALPAAAAALGRRRGEDRRHGRGGRGGGGLPGGPLPRPRAGPDRPLARERPGGTGQRHRSTCSTRPRWASHCPRARRACPIPPGPGITPRRRSQCASLLRSSRRSSAPAMTSRCGARTCARRWNGRPRSTERGGAGAPRCHSFRL